jgi:hypothetical protein
MVAGINNDNILTKYLKHLNVKMVVEMMMIIIIF